MTEEIHIKHRHRARTLALQALYQYSYVERTVDELISQYKESNTHQYVDWDFFERLLKGAYPQVEQLDELFVKWIEREASSTLPIERAALRLGAFELKECLDVPYKSVIDEYVELTKTFGAQEGHTFVNGILDKLARELREAEVQAN